MTDYTELEADEIPGHKGFEELLLTQSEYEHLENIAEEVGAENARQAVGWLVSDYYANSEDSQ